LQLEQAVNDLIYEDDDDDYDDVFNYRPHHLFLYPVFTILGGCSVNWADICTSYKNAYMSVVRILKQN